MTDETIKRANFGFDVDFADLSSVKPSGPPKTKPAAKPKKAKPKAVSESTKAARPKPKVRKVQDELADELAKSRGFTSREAAPAPAPAPLLMKKRRRVQHAEPVDQLSIRGPVRVLNGFIDYCEANKLSYWEGLERLVQQASE